MRGLALLIFLLLLSAVLSCDNDECEAQGCDRNRSADPSSEKAPVLGADTASVDVTVFGDLKCPYTKEMLIALDRFVEDLEKDGRGNELKIVFRHLFREDSAESRDAAVAVAAAHRQGDDAVWGSQGKVGVLWCLLFKEKIDYEQILSCAKSAILDMERFVADFWGDEASAEVDQDLESAKEFSFGGTPGIVMCGDRIDGGDEKIIDCIEKVLEVEENLVDKQKTLFFAVR